MIHSEERSMSLHARLGPNHGYSIEGDVALLHAEVAVPNDPRSARLQWALQLWACEAPHAGGPLSGVKVAEAALPATVADDPLRLDTEALARVPGGMRDYSMVLVLAAGEPGSVDQVHDFANYPQRQRFITPHLEGSVGYRIEGDSVVLTAERVRNPRREGNLSGSLELSLWAQAEEYAGGALEGTLVASAELGRIEGQRTLDALEHRLAFNPPQPGSVRMVLALREWAGPAGYVTRDFCNFALPYQARASEPAPEARTRDAEPAKLEPSEVAAPTAPIAVKSQPAAKAPLAPAAPPSVAPSDDRISISDATLDELTAVKGMNRKLAQGIMKGRPFKSLDELIKVRGIGPKLLAALKPFVKL